MQSNEDDPRPDYDDFSGDTLVDDFDDGDFDEDWEWDYRAPPRHTGHGRHSSSNGRHGGGGGYGDYPDPYSHRGQGRTSFATDYDHRNRYDGYFEPPPFGNSRRNTFPRGYEEAFMYRDEFGPPSHHDRWGNTIPRDFGREYPDPYRSRGYPQGGPYSYNHNHPHHYGPTHGSPQHRRPSHRDPYDRLRVYPGPPPHGAHYPHGSGHGRDRLAIDGPARSNRREGFRKKISRKLRNMIGAFMMYAMT